MGRRVEVVSGNTLNAAGKQNVHHMSILLLHVCITHNEVEYEQCVLLTERVSLTCPPLCVAFGVR